MFRKIYLSKLGYFISFALNIFAICRKHFMVYGYYNKTLKVFFKNTRISSSAVLLNKNNLDISDNVWIGPYCLLDGSKKLIISEGVQLASHSVIYTHSSQNAIRFNGKHYIKIPAEKRSEYIFGEVFIGDYSFIGTSCVILPGTYIGKGCIVGAGSVIKGDFPDYSIIVGNPAKIIGDTRKTDCKLVNNGTITDYYYDKKLLNTYKNEKIL